MSAITPETRDKIFEAIQVIRDFLPEAEAISELLPVIGDDLVKGEKFLAKLFELVSVLDSHNTTADAAVTLRKQTEETWKAALQGDPR